MADYGFIDTKLAGLPDEQRRIFGPIFEYLVKEIRFGRGASGEPAKNFGGGFFTGTTPSVANDEFSIVHNFGHAPYLVIPILFLNQVNSTIVRLKVTRVPDATRIYLSSPDADAVFFLYVEG